MAKVNDLYVDVGARTDKLQRGLKKANSQVSAFQKSVQRIGGMIAGAFAVSRIFRFAGSVGKAYDVQAKSERELLVALKGREDVQQRLIRQAKELQKTTLFGDEETIQAQALIAAFTKEEISIKRIIPLVQDLAIAKKMQLNVAADLVSKTLGSTTNALSRYGISVEGAVGSTERLESLVKGLTNAFEGQAKAAAETGLGPLTQLKNIFGDLKESIGEAIIETDAFKDSIEDLKNKVYNSNRILDSDLKLWEKLLLTWAEFNNIPLDLSPLDEVDKSTKKITEDITTLGTSTAKTTKEIVDLNRILYELSQTQGALSEDIQGFKGAGDFGDVLPDPIVIENVADKISENLKKIEEPILSLRAGFKAMSEDLIAMGASSKGLKDYANIVIGESKRIIGAFLGETVAAALKSSFASLPFPFNIAMAPAIGGGVAALFNRLIPSFGEGALVTKPTMALVGEKGPEIITPLNKAQPQFIVLETRISDRYIYLMNKSYEKRLNRYA